MGRAVKMNNETVPLDELTSEHSLELESGSSVNVVFKTYQTNDGTVLYITSPQITVGVSLVSSDTTPLSTISRVVVIHLNQP